MHQPMLMKRVRRSQCPVIPAKEAVIQFRSIAASALFSSFSRKREPRDFSRLPLGPRLRGDDEFVCPHDSLTVLHRHCRPRRVMKLDATRCPGESRDPLIRRSCSREVDPGFRRGSELMLSRLGIVCFFLALKAGTQAADIARFAGSTESSPFLRVLCGGAIGPGFLQGDKSVNGNEALRFFRRVSG